MKKTRYFDSFAEYHDFYEENGHEINRVDVVAGPLWIVADAEIECRGWRTALRRFESALSEDEQFSWTVGYYADAMRVDDVDGRFDNDCDGYMIEQLSDGLWYVAARTAVKTAEDDETETGDEESSEDQSEERETAEETETDRDGETVAESLVLPTDSDRVRAICERIAENIAEYATMPVDSLDVCIADGNEKVGHIKNVSQPPVISCRGVCAECGGDCYDGRAVLQYPDTAAARGRNWSIYCRDPLAYIGQIIGTVRRMRKRFFRWHVGGEIVDGLYFRLMVATARLAPRVTFLCFTKRHKLVADELAAMGGRDALPSNLRLILSAWPGLPLYNPYNLPVSAPYAGDKPRTWYGCPGNCEDCAARNIGCWSLPSGAVVGFAYHGTAGDLFAERFAAWEDRPAGRRPKRTASSKKGAATA